MGAFQACEHDGGQTDYWGLGSAKIIVTELKISNIYKRHLFCAGVFFNTNTIEDTEQKDPMSLCLTGGVDGIII